MVHRTRAVVVSNMPSRVPRAASALAHLAESFIAAHGAPVLSVAAQECSEGHLLVQVRYQEWLEAATDRERSIARAMPSAARRLVQSGLFDGRQANGLAARQRAAALALLEGDERWPISGRRCGCERGREWWRCVSGGGRNRDPRDARHLALTRCALESESVARAGGRQGSSADRGTSVCPPARSRPCLAGANRVRQDRDDCVPRPGVRGPAERR